jgi:hypothetical protein
VLASFLFEVRLKYGSESIEAISKRPNSPISASGLNRNPRNINIYSSDYLKKPKRLFHKMNPRPAVGIHQILAPSLTSNYFSIFEIASSFALKAAYATMSYLSSSRKGRK